MRRRVGAGLLVLCACVHRAHAELHNTTLACDLTEISQAVRTAVRAKVARLSPWLDACEPTLAAVVGDDDAPDMPPDTCARVARQHAHAQAALRFAEEQEYWLTGERWHLLNPATLVHEAQQFRCAPRAWSGPALMAWTVSHSLAKRTSLLPLYESAENSSVQLLSPPAAERLASVLRTSLGGAMPLAEVRVIMQQTTNGSSMCAQLDDVLVPGMLLADVFRRQRGECTLSGAESWLRDRAWLHATTHNSLLASPPAQHTIVQSLTRDVNIFIISAELASLLALLPHRNATRMWHAVARSGVSQLQRAAREGGACALGDNRSTAGNELLKLISAATGLPMDSGSAQDEGCAVHDVWTDNADESAEVSGSHHLRVHASVFHESSRQPPTCASMISTLIAKVMLQQATPLTLHPGEAVFIPAGSAFMWTSTPASATPGSVSAEMLPPLLLLAHYTDATNWNAAASEWLGSSLLTQLSPTTRANAKHFLAQVAATAAEGALSTDAPATTNLAQLLLDTRDGEPPSMRADKLLAKKSHGQDTHAHKPNELGGERGASGEPLSSPEQGGANTLSRAARLLARRHSAAAAGGHASRNEAGTRTNVQNGDAPLNAHLNAHLAGNESAQGGERPASPRWLTGTGSSIRWNQAVRSWALPTPRILHASYDASAQEVHLVWECEQNEEAQNCDGAGLLIHVQRDVAPTRALPSRARQLHASISPASATVFDDGMFEHSMLSGQPAASVMAASFKTEEEYVRPDVEDGAPNVPDLRVLVDANETRPFFSELAHSTAARRLRHKKARYMQSRGQLAFERPLNVSSTHDREEEENVIMQSLLDEAVLDVARQLREAAMNGDEDLEVHDGMARRLQPDRLLWEDGGGAQGAPSSAGGALPHASSEFALTAHARVAQRLLSVSMVQSRAQCGRSAASVQRRIADDLEWSLLHGDPERILQAAALQAPAASTFFLAARTPSVLQSIERQQSEGARLLRDRLALAATVAVLAAAVTEPACDWWQPPGSATLIRAAHLGVVHCAKLPLASLGNGAALRIAAITRDARVSTFSAQSAKLLPAATRVHPRRLTSSSSTLSASATGAATVTLTLQAPPQPDDTLSILGFLVMRQQCVEQPVEESARGAGLLVQAVGPYTCTDFGHPVIVEFTQQEAERSGDASVSGSSVQLALTGLAPGGTYAWVAAAVTAAGVATWSQPSNLVTTPVTNPGSSFLVLARMRRGAVVQTLATPEDGTHRCVHFGDTAFVAERAAAHDAPVTLLARLATLHAATSIAFEHLDALRIERVAVGDVNSAHVLHMVDAGTPLFLCPAFHASDLLSRSGLGVEALDAHVHVAASAARETREALYTLEHALDALLPRDEQLMRARIDARNAALQLWTDAFIADSLFFSQPELCAVLRCDVSSMLLPGLGGINNFAVNRANQVSAVVRAARSMPRASCNWTLGGCDEVMREGNASQAVQFTRLLPPNATLDDLRQLGRAHPHSMRPVYRAIAAGRVEMFTEALSAIVHTLKVAAARTVRRERGSPPTGVHRHLSAGDARNFASSMCAPPLLSMNTRNHSMRVHFRNNATELPAWTSHWTAGDARVTALLVWSVPPTGSRTAGGEGAENAAEFKGKIVVFTRGNIALSTKVALAAAHGALGVVIVDDVTDRCKGSVFDHACVPGSSLAAGQGFGQADSATAWQHAHIPAQLISHRSGQYLMAIADIAAQRAC